MSQDDDDWGVEVRQDPPKADVANNTWGSEKGEPKNTSSRGQAEQEEGRRSNRDEDRSNVKP